MARLTPAQIDDYARLLDEHVRSVRELVRLTASNPSLALEDAYLVQDAGVALRTARGETVVGLKMGLTSRAKMAQMGVDAPIYGVLLDSMRLEDGGTVALAGRIHPKIEPEIAFVTARDLRGPVTVDEVLDACSGVAPAMEVIDSRYLNFEFQLPDVVADNTSGSGFVVGALRPPRSVDLADLRMTLSVDGEVVETGSSKEILGHPAESVAELCRMLHARGRHLPAGSVVLAGAATKAILLQPGRRYRLDVDGLGSTELTTPHN